MPHRQPVELVAELTPLRHEGIHQRDETLVVRRLEKMREFMHEDILEAFGGLLRKVGIDADAPRVRVAASPPGLLLPDGNTPIGHTHFPGIVSGPCT